MLNRISKVAVLIAVMSAMSGCWPFWGPGGGGHGGGGGGGGGHYEGGGPGGGGGGGPR
ncbi:hypothetical protein [Pseudomonas sp. LP_7_YM]|uniref:hypothetical protein n=1 Tax=Pseudomonas sp. LP_7_YM TaxID=2485137 RepID=UPI001414CE3F|nr:hypothetical protein [Pseudomonas sp. LP_7_YM]